MKKEKYRIEAKKRLISIKNFEQRLSTYTKGKLLAIDDKLRSGKITDKIKNILVQHYLQQYEPTIAQRPNQIKRQIKYSKFIGYKFDSYKKYVKSNVILNGIYNNVYSGSEAHPIHVDYVRHLRDLALGGTKTEQKIAIHFVYDYYNEYITILRDMKYYFSGRKNKLFSMTPYNRSFVDILKQSLITSSTLHQEINAEYENEYIFIGIMTFWFLTFLPNDMDVNFYKFITTLQSVCPELLIGLLKYEKQQSSHNASKYWQHFRGEVSAFWKKDYSIIFQNHNTNTQNSEKLFNNTEMLQKLKSYSSENDFLEGYEYFLQLALEKQTLYNGSMSKQIHHTIPFLYILFSPQDISRYCQIKIKLNTVDGKIEKTLFNDARYLALQNILLWYSKNDDNLLSANKKCYFYILGMYKPMIRNIIASINFKEKIQHHFSDDELEDIIQDIFEQMFDSYQYNLPQAHRHTKTNPYLALFKGNTPNNSFSNHLSPRSTGKLYAGGRSLYMRSIKEVAKRAKRSLKDHSEEGRIDNIVDENKYSRTSDNPEMALIKEEHEDNENTSPTNPFPLMWTEYKGSFACALVNLSDHINRRGFSRKKLPKLIKFLNYRMITGNDIVHSDSTLRSKLKYLLDAVFIVVPKAKLNDFISEIIDVDYKTRKYKKNYFIATLNKIIFQTRIQEKENGTDEMSIESKYPYPIKKNRFDNLVKKYPRYFNGEKFDYLSRDCIENMIKINGLIKPRKRAINTGISAQK